MRTTTRRIRADVDCIRCGRPGWWRWDKRVVEHGFRKEDWCDLKQPVVKIIRGRRVA